MKAFAVLVISSALASPALGASAFDDIWTQLASDPYPSLPHYEATLGSFFHILHNKLKDASNRTLNDHDDMLPSFQKLIHANGVCLAGTWNITEDTPYTGYFARGTQAAVIVRASVALSITDRGNRRTFGFAGKIFANDGAAGTPVDTANFFAVDDLGGTNATYLTTAMTNEPKLSLPPLSEAAAGTAVLETFAAVDSHTRFRQLYEVSELGLADPAEAKTPHWLQITAEPGQAVDAVDFREELRGAVANRGHLTFTVSVSGPENGSPVWHDIGKIELTQAAASDSCDHRLHFHHPRWVDGLAEPDLPAN